MTIDNDVALLDTPVEPTINLSKLDYQIMVSAERGFYDADELDQIFIDLDAYSVHRDICEAFVARTRERMYVDGTRVTDVLLDLRNLVSPPTYTEILDEAEATITDDLEGL